jgi:hypothetical protein
MSAVRGMTDHTRKRAMSDLVRLGKSQTGHIESASPPESEHEVDMPDWPLGRRAAGCEFSKVSVVVDTTH